MRNTKPPILADKFLSWFCKDELLEEIQGDLHEYFERIASEKKRWVAYAVYCFHVANFLRPFAIRKFKGQNLIYTTMFKSNLIIALRNLSKHKFYAGLNISGLALGLCCCIFIIIWATDELSYDKFFENYERIYRVSGDLKFQDNEYSMAVTPAPMAETFKAEFPEIIQSGRIRTVGNTVFQKGDRYIDQDNIMYIDDELLSILSFELIDGDLQSALKTPNTVVITRSVAEKFFDRTDVTGEILINNLDEQFEIEAVIEDLPTNAHMHPKVMISMTGYEPSRDGIWLSNNYYTYFLLDENNDPEALVEKFSLIYPKYFGPQLEQIAGANWEELVQSGSYVRYFLINVGDIHLYSIQDFEIEANSSIQYVYIFAAIGIFILIIGCINFMNISTARASIRGKEVGVRKVLGSFRHQLINQFLTESVLSSLLALIIAMVLVSILLPFFENLTGKIIGNPFAGNQTIWTSVFLGTVLIGLLAGVYPAFVLSGFRPAAVLKGQLKSGRSGAFIRSLLVIFQFSMSVVMIVGTSVVYKQLQYIQNQNLGFDKEKVLILNNTFTLDNKVDEFKEELLSNPRIESVTATGFIPTGNWRSDNAMQPKEASNADDVVACQIWSVDHDYVRTMGMKVIEGRDFSKDLVSDSLKILVNEVAVKRFGYEDPVGRKIKTVGDFQVNGATEFTIIGVLGDFHFDSMRDNILPMFLMLDESNATIALRYNSDDVRSVVADVEATWKKFSPNRPLDYDFMDRQFDAKYEAEVRLGEIFAVFGILAIIIACLGLFGLSAFTAEQRRKEIGIRKVLGASVPSLVGLLFFNYSRLVAISLVVGLPIAYLLMDSWLSDFAYHTNIGAGVIIASAIMSFSVASFTVTFQSMKAAKANPADNLRTE